MNKNITLLIVAVAMSLLSISYLSRGNTIKEDVAQVVSIQWITTTNTYEKVIRHSAQWSGLPHGAFNGHCKVKERGTSYCFCKVNDYETCQRCPVSDMWCEYDYWDWRPLESLEVSGANYTPMWPDIVVVGNNQRLEARIKFEVVFTGDQTYNPENLYEFQSFKVGDTWKFKPATFGKIKPVKLLKSGGE